MRPTLSPPNITDGTQPRDSASWMKEHMHVMISRSKELWTDHIYDESRRVSDFVQLSFLTSLPYHAWPDDFPSSTNGNVVTPQWDFLILPSFRDRRVVAVLKNADSAVTAIPRSTFLCKTHTTLIGKDVYSVHFHCRESKQLIMILCIINIIQDIMGPVWRSVKNIYF